MNVIFSSDENYVQHLGVSMLSLIKCNTQMEEINVFIILNGISEESKIKLEELAQKYNRQVFWIEFAPFREKLELDLEWPFSLSAYARLFIPDMLPDWCERVIYLDCDTVVCKSLESMWSLDIGTYSVAGVEDLVKDAFKEKVGIGSSDIYVNSGVLLIDVKKWRQRQAVSTFMSFINSHKGRVTHHDQGVINGTMTKECYRLPPEYNAITPFFTTEYKRMISFYQKPKYYSREEILKAKEEPVIIHYTPELVGRVWEHECTHPRADLYRELLRETEWKNGLVHAKKQSVKSRILNWMQKNLPIAVLDVIIPGR